MEKRTWLAVLLMCAIWFGYVTWFAPIPQKPTTTVTTTTTTASGETKTTEVVSGSLPADATFVDVAPSEGPEYSNANFIVNFSSNGGNVKSLTLQKYKNSVSKTATNIELINHDNAPHLTNILFTNPELVELSKKSFTSEKTGNTVILNAAQSGIALQKAFSFSDNSYVIDAEYKFTFPTADKKEWGYAIIPLGAKNPTYDRNSPLSSWEAVAFQNEKVTRHTVDSIKAEDQVLQGQTGWAAFGNKYFATAIVTQSEINPDVVFTKKQNFTGAYLRYPLVLRDGQKELILKTKIFAGPKDVTVLSQFPAMKKLIDYGTFEFFAHALLAILKFFYGLVHNYGVAIILLTILVRLLFYPLSVKSMRSMKAMQKLSPQIAAIKEKYKDDMKKQNEEQMALFKTHKVNPAGGCLPMLLQLPVFIALYAVLGNSIELFQAPFFGWIGDLSVKDPFYIYPVLMGLAMLWQQKLTPSVGMDPVQQKMMMFMPLIFTFMMINLPSGLTMYIFVSTLLGIVQQISLRDPKSVANVGVPVSGHSK